VRRSYAQYCTLARALDVLGERWTILIVRELLVRPKRFGELLDGLPGIGRNLLAQRLRQLEADRLVRRGAHGYELTDDGAGLAPALTELARWGARRLGELTPDDAFQGQWIMGTITATADLDAARGLHEAYQFNLDGDVFHVLVDDGVVSSRPGSHERPDLVVHMAPQTLAALAAGTLQLPEALGDGRVRVEGEPVALQHAIAVIGGVWGIEPGGA
jgi:DNA-binding HxlR family transcriptional regulator/putative sterol carrier protein